MKISSILPKAEKISHDERNNQNTENRIINFGSAMKIALILFGIVIVFGLVVSCFDDYTEENPSLHYALVMVFVTLLSASIIMFFISTINVVISNGRIVCICSDQGGRVNSAPLITALLIFLVFYACVEGSKGNPKGAYPAYALIDFLIIRGVFRLTLKPVVISLAVLLRKRRCTEPIRAELFRKIETHKQPDEETQKLYADSGREIKQYYDNIFVYEYCREDQYYHIFLNEMYCSSSENYEYYDIDIDPEHPEYFMINKHFYFTVNKKEMSFSFWFLVFALLFTSPIWFTKVLDFIANLF